MHAPSPQFGVLNQVASESDSFASADSAHVWRVPVQYNIATDIVDRWADDPERSDDIALAVLEDDDDDTRRYSWRQIQQMSRRTAHALSTRLAVDRGDVVAVILGQSAEAAVVHIATYRLGAVLCPISHLFGADAMSWRLKHCGAAVVVTDGPGLRTLQSQLPAMPALRHVIVVDDHSTKESSIPSTHAPAVDVHDFTALVGQAQPEFETAPTAPDDPALLIYTSGTSGTPKGVLHGHRVALGHAPLSYLLDTIRSDDSFYSPNDWSWIAGVGNGLLAPWGFGLTVYSMGHRRFDAKAVARLIDRYRPALGFLPPSALRLVRSAGVELTHPFRAILSGGEVLDDDLSSWCRAHICTAINVGFGQTEANDIIGAVAAWETPRPDSIGRVLPGHHAAVLGPDGELLADGEEGELCVKADRPNVFLEYLHDPNATAAVLRGGWVHTGDMVRRDEAGYFHFVGRNDDVIKSSGYRIGPTEIENALRLDPRVVECAVIGVPDPERGQLVTAVVKLAGEVPDAEAVFAELTRSVRDRVGKHAYPRRFEIVDDFPKTVTGKIRRSELRNTLTSRARPNEGAHQ